MPVEPKPRALRAAAQAAAPKSTRSSQALSSKKSSQSSAEAEERKNHNILVAEKKRKWSQQYYQGRSILELQDLGCGRCLLVSREIQFGSPFSGRGLFEVMSGMGSPQIGSIRICKGMGFGRFYRDVFMVPMQHVEQVIVIPDTVDDLALGTDAMFLVVIIPTAAAGTSALTQKYPQMINFKWPNRSADEALEQTVVNKSDEEMETYLSVLKTAIDDTLAPFDKEVIVYTDEGQAVSQPPLFRCIAELEPVSGTFITEKAKEAFNEEGTKSKTIRFADMQDFSPLQDMIEKYSEAHGIKLMKLEQTYYDYAEGQMMTGFMPMMGALAYHGRH
ncbi:hypothetical protein G7Z17_g2720 [Cylindrodendrum hubeiense]|uniref:Uncharacterized protein n=1 Tax=Cylindrodendrum hubeiense TaxID=595255 RepID=A0A9P5LBE7_9HYPO|nr:hypothetical protein G7Z17_g2720 [Cylindrodendrum hubeiense]